MNYREALLYLNSFIDYEKNGNFVKRNFKLKRFKSFLETIDNPHQNLNVIHVAGTKGKGSVCVFISYILKSAGFKTGLYTSPHLVSFQERIRVLIPQQKISIFEGAISKKEVAMLVTKLKPSMENFNQRNNLGKLTFFEVYTAIAFCYFKKQKVDWVVLETGLGGRLDATNVVRNKIACITPISLEHMNVLGNTLTKIASEKLGIIRNKRTTLITAPQEKEVERLFKEKTRQFQLNLIKLNKNQIKQKASNFKYQLFDLETKKNNYKNLKIKLLGKHQLINASLAVLTCENLNIKRSVIYKGLRQAFWPARFEILNTNPYIIVDGAQNGASFGSLNNTLNQYFKDYKKILILGICEDKDIKTISQMLEIYGTIILSQSQNPRAMPVNLMKNFIEAHSARSVAGGLVADLTTNINSALKAAKDIVDKKTIIVISGSLFLAAEARELLNKQNA